MANLREELPDKARAAMVRCNICNLQFEAVFEAFVRSNVRNFKHEQFWVWRCPVCLSVHARDEVDLAHYYASYPLHRLADSGDVSWMLSAMYRSQLRRLRAAGLRHDHAILDYGCGDGGFVRFLRDQGYARAAGYDAYSREFTDERVLSGRYDCVLTQDVLEHVPEPWDLLHRLSDLTAPGGNVVIGTPNAQSIDLRSPEQYVHTLHVPYHRHILSEAVLLTLGERLNWELLRYYPRMYTNTLMPFVNQRFVLHYFRACDDTIELANEPIQVNNPKLYRLSTLFWALFGYFFAPSTDVTVVYRKHI